MTVTPFSLATDIAGLSSRVLVAMTGHAPLSALERARNDLTSLRKLTASLSIEINAAIVTEQRRIKAEAQARQTAEKVNEAIRRERVEGEDIEAALWQQEMESHL